MMYLLTKGPHIIIVTPTAFEADRFCDWTWAGTIEAKSAPKRRWSEEERDTE